MTATPYIQEPCFEEYAGRLRSLVDLALEKVLSSTRVAGDELIHDAVRYSLLSGGKRIRPMLTLAVTELLNGDIDAAMPAACALELLHCSSLILDDLPSMDNAGLRRGRAANHLVFGEDVSVLASVHLLNLAYRLILNYSFGRQRRDSGTVLRLLTSLNSAIGMEGLIGGQLGDLHPERLPDSFAVLNTVYERKTVRLFSFAAEAGALLAGATEAELAALASYAKNMGLAFQVCDDFLDRRGMPHMSGKDVGKDCDKRTLLNMTDAGTTERMANELVLFAARQLSPFGVRAGFLLHLPDLIFQSSGLTAVAHVA